MSAEQVDISVVKWNVSVGGASAVDATIVIPSGCNPLIYSKNVAMMLTGTDEHTAKKHFQHVQNYNPVLKSRGNIQDHMNVS